MKITALKCPKCRDLIYSRAVHDFHYCTCGSVSIDGGFDYCRMGHSKDLKFDDLKWVDVKVKATKHELYQDWNCHTDKFGVIKNDQ